MTASISGCLKPNIYLNLHTMEDHLPLGVFWDIENCDVPSGKTFIYLTRPGVDKVKPKVWFKYSL